MTAGAPMALWRFSIWMVEDSLVLEMDARLPLTISTHHQQALVAAAFCPLWAGLSCIGCAAARASHVHSQALIMNVARRSLNLQVERVKLSQEATDCWKVDPGAIAYQSTVRLITGRTHQVHRARARACLVM